MLDADVARLGEVFFPRKEKNLIGVATGDGSGVVVSFVVDADDDKISSTVEALDDTFDVMSFILYGQCKG